MRLSSLRGKQGILIAAAVAFATTRTNFFRLLSYLVRECVKKFPATLPSLHLCGVVLLTSRARPTVQQPITFPRRFYPPTSPVMDLTRCYGRAYYSSICCRKTRETVPALGQGRKPRRSLRRAAWKVTMLLLLLRVCGRDGGVAWSGVWTTASSTWRLTAGTPIQVYYNTVFVKACGRIASKRGRGEACGVLFRCLLPR